MRPEFNQPVEDSVVEMEREGFPVDVEWCRESAARAEADEAKALRWLYTWGFTNAPEEFRGLSEAEWGATWSSPTKLVKLMDALGWPRSPIWKKGRVKRGDVKTDGVAMEWIARNHPEAAQFVKHYIHLKRIRSGKKYLVKLRDSGGYVHPICGPAGDGDDRNGAVTGRLGIKGTLEAAQLPTKEELDLYQVRKAIVCAPGQTLLVADYSALEVVVLADLTLRLFGDRGLADSVAPGAPDIHVKNAKYVFGTFLGWKVPEMFRGVACTYAGLTADQIPDDEFKKHPFGAFLRDNIKTVFYGWCYGKRGFGFATLLGADGKMIGDKTGDAMCAGLMKAMPGLGKWERWVEGFVNEHHGIYSLGGRWCDLSTEMETGEDWMARRAYRRALNFPCQASGADIIGDAMVRVHADEEFRALGYRIVLQVHDELVCVGPIEHLARATELLRKHMTEATANGTRLLIPLGVSTGSGPNYWEAK